MILVISYLFVVSLLVVMLLKQRASIRFHVALIALAGLFIFWHAQNWYAVQGYATYDELPEEFELINFSVSKKDTKQWIYMTVSSESNPEPRLYALPYVAKDFELLRKAAVRKRQGHRQLGVIKKGEGKATMSFKDMGRSGLPPKQ